MKIKMLVGWARASCASNDAKTSKPRNIFWIIVRGNLAAGRQTLARRATAGTQSFGDRIVCARGHEARIGKREARPGLSSY